MLDIDPGSGECGGYAVVALRGELDLMDAEAVAVGLGAVAAREPRIIVDLAGLEFIDASGITALVRGRGQARNAGGDLLLAAPQRQVRRVLAISWERDGFSIHASVAEAAASAGASRRAVAPIWRQSARVRRQRGAVNAPLRSSAPSPATGSPAVVVAATALTIGILEERAERHPSSVAAQSLLRTPVAIRTQPVAAHRRSHVVRNTAFHTRRWWT